MALTANQFLDVRYAGSILSRVWQLQSKTGIRPFVRSVLFMHCRHLLLFAPLALAFPAGSSCSSLTPHTHAPYKQVVSTSLFFAKRPYLQKVHPGSSTRVPGYRVPVPPISGPIVMIPGVLRRAPLTPGPGPGRGLRVSLRSSSFKFRVRWQPEARVSESAIATVLWLVISSTGDSSR
eukprot:1993970-Rhodomonas_salina.2